jgi:hypothetical protein
MIRLFMGYDDREAVGSHVFIQSIIQRTKEPVSITVLSGPQRDSTNSFGYSRFLVPHLAYHSGIAIFADGADMLLRADLNELWELRDPFKAVQVVKHKYMTKHRRKYVGTEMETDNRDYPCKNWSSLIIWNCAHYANRALTPAYVEKEKGENLHSFGWLEEDQIGSLPMGWNWLCDEYGPNDDAKLLHWTAGMPGFEHYKDAPHAGEWRALASQF